MNKEQRIKEIAEIATTAYNSNHAKLLKEIQDNAVMRESKNPPTAIATALYEAGYRKQSDVAREFAERAKIKLTDKSGWVTHKCLDLCWEIDEIAKEFGVEEL